MSSSELTRLRAMIALLGLHIVERSASHIQIRYPAGSELRFGNGLRFRDGLGEVEWLRVALEEYGIASSE